MIELDQINIEMVNFKDSLQSNLHPNLLPIEHFIILHEGATFAVRQYVKYNLRDRLVHAPKIEMIQKKWIIFQLLYAVQQFQKLDVFHGHITPDNVMVDSTDWVYLTDFLFFRPIFLKTDDHSLNNSYFGDFINKNRWYIAPERIQDTDKKQNFTKKDLFAMDIFSLGCVIAEILKNGRPLFDFPRLLDYKKGTLTIDETYFDSELKDFGEIVKMVLNMVDVNPLNRKNINQYLLDFVTSSVIEDSYAFPISFKNILYPLGKALIQPEFLLSDDRIGLIYYNYDRIHSEIFGEPAKGKVLRTTAMSPQIFEKVKRYSTLFNHEVTSIKLSQHSSDSKLEEIKEAPNEINDFVKDADKSKMLSSKSKKEGIILLNMIVNNMPY